MMANPKVPDATVADALVTAFRREGYAGAAIRDLAEATGLKSASLYHRFPTKADMALAALQRASDDFARQVILPLEASEPAPKRLAACADGLSRFYGQGQVACLLAVFAASETPDAVSAAVAASFAQWRGALAAVLEEAGLPEPCAAAEDRIAAVQGALILARATGEGGAFARAVARMAELP